MNQALLLIVLLLAFLSSGKTFAQATSEEILAEDDVRLLETEWENSNERLKQLEVTKGELQKQQIILIRDTETGLMENYNTGTSKKRFAVAQHFHSDVKDFSKIKMFDLNFGYNFKEHLWFEVFLATTNAKYEEIAQPNTNRSLDVAALNDTSETMLTTGVGMGLTTTFLRDFLKFDNMFETYSGYLAFGRLSEDFMTENFQGPGLRADWGVHWRMTQFFHLGGKFSWNHYSVKRAEAFLDEAQSARHLSISWLSLGIEGAIYF